MPARRTGARRIVVAGAAHSPQRLGGPFNDLLATWVDHVQAATCDASTCDP